jgi:chitin disaccharide deacetylase
MKRIILCADDYGQNSAISQAIVALIEKKRLSATSCLTTTSSWEVAAKALKPYINQVDIGLHFNLTYPHTALSGVIFRAYLRQLSKQDIRKQLQSQFDAFSAALGKMPDFIDGHQHVLQLPQIRDVICDFYQCSGLRDTGCYLRTTAMHNVFTEVLTDGFWKRCIIQLCGASALQKQLLANKIPHNSSFSGVYKFAHSKYYGHIFPSFLQKIRDNGLIMCHPGFASIEDCIATARFDEYTYFQSEQFISTLKAQNIVLSRYLSS